MSILLDDAYELHPQVSLRDEPFGALAYHFGNRRLSFLRSHEMVRVVTELADSPDVTTAFDRAGIETARRPSFVRALERLAAGDMIRPRRADTAEPA
ncbi:MAG: mycofactocin biosynthesis chaperone MftB [Microthrixaceae bacterium]